MNIGVVIPCYREDLTIARLVGALRALLPSAWIVVVDDSPDDATGAAVSSVADARVQYVHRTEKGGRGSAVLVGLRFLVEQEDIDTFIEMDADFSHDPGEIPRLASTLKERGADLVIGSRYIAQSEIHQWPVGRHVFSACSNWLARKVLEVPVADYTNGFRCYSRRAADLVSKECGRYGKGFISLSETLVNLHFRGFTIVEVPTRFVNRVRGESSLTKEEVTNALRGLWMVAGLKRTLQSRTR